MTTKSNFTVCAGLIDRAIPDPDPRECDWTTMKYKVNVPQRELDLINGSTSSDITILTDGLVLFGSRIGDASLSAFEAQSAGHFVAAISEIIGALAIVADRASTLIGHQPDTGWREHTITLDAATEEALEQAAAAAGKDADELAAEILRDQLRRDAKGGNR